MIIHNDLFNIFAIKVGVLDLLIIILGAFV